MFEKCIKFLPKKHNNMNTISHLHIISHLLISKKEFTNCL